MSQKFILQTMYVFRTLEMSHCAVKSTTAKHFDYSREQFMFIKNWQLHIHKSRKRYKSQAFMYLYYFYGMIKKTHKFWMISWFGHLKKYKSHKFSHNHLHFFPDKFIYKLHTSICSWKIIGIMNYNFTRRFSLVFIHFM